jgi:hypothetical protein
MRLPAADRPLRVSDLVGRFKEDHRHADSFGWHRWGACGIGKSRIVAQVADDIECEFLDVRAVQLVLGRRLSEYRRFRILDPGLHFAALPGCPDVELDENSFAALSFVNLRRCGSPRKFWPPYRVTMGSRPAYDVLRSAPAKGRC